jgi:hypothetical protein
MTRNILRWAIGSHDGPRSSAWRVWGMHQGDLYVAVRSLGGVIKASLHRDGRSYLGFTSEYAATAAARFGRQGRHWGTWQLPVDRIAVVFQILVPQRELRHFVGRDNSKLIWLAPPPVGSIAVISIFVAPPPIELAAETSPSANLVGIVRTQVRSAWVFCANSIDATLRQTIAAEQAKLRRLPKPSGLKPGTRAVLWESRADDGCRRMLELASES